MYECKSHDMDPCPACDTHEELTPMTTSEYHTEYRELHFPLYAVYDTGGNFEVAFPTQQQADDYVRDHR